MCVTFPVQPTWKKPFEFVDTELWVNLQQQVYIH